MPAEHPPPLVLALVLADNGHLDPVSDKYYILGIISGIRAASFPTEPADLCVYAALTEGRGKTGISIRLIDTDEAEEPVCSADEEVEFETPLSVIEPMVIMEEIEFPEPGVYRLQLHSGEHLLSEIRLNVEGTQEPDAES